MFKKILRKFGQPVEFSTYHRLLEKINQICLSELSEAQLYERINDYKNKFKSAITASDINDMNRLIRESEFVDIYLIECYAITKEICKRQLGLEPYDSQMLTAVSLHFGNITELPTGEGKTMAAVFPVVFNALTGKGVHILTFNEYLAERDATWMESIYSTWGLSVEYLQSSMPAERRKAAYNADITYLTPREAGFDFLRDSLAYSQEELVQRPFNYVIVDEADSILIDEARVPLVIAGKVGIHTCSIDKSLVKIINGLLPQIHYQIDENKRNAYLTDEGINILEGELKCGSLYSDNLEILTLINNLLHAKALLKRDVDYIVRNNRIEIVDEFSGRVAEKRRWNDGLQMALEAIEGIDNTQNSRILGKITLQNLISLYPEMAGMTATAQSSEDELLDSYNRRVYVVKPYKKSIRIDHPDEIFTHREARDKAVITEIIEVNKTGRPILVGTSTIEESEILSQKLKASGISAVVLNAKNDAEEAGIIANAGRHGAVTVSTNMAGRGVDIRLGDGQDSEETRKVIALGGLYVIGVNKNECIRIDNQLRGRAGRQGDPGASRFFISLEDDLLLKLGIEKVLPQKYKAFRQVQAISDSRLNELVNHMQRVIDGQNFDIRKSLGKYSLLLEYQRRILVKYRNEFVYGELPSLLALKQPALYSELCAQYGREHVELVSQYVSIHYIDECWYAFLDYCESVQEGIHLVRATRKVPLDEYRKLVIEEFDSIVNRLDNGILSELEKTDFSISQGELTERGFCTPAATWTYIVNDNIKVKKFSLFSTV